MKVSVCSASKWKYSWIDRVVGLVLYELRTPLFSETPSIVLIETDLYPKCQLWCTFKKKNTQTQALTSHEMQNIDTYQRRTKLFFFIFFLFYYGGEKSFLSSWISNQFLDMPSYSFWRLIINCGWQQYPAAGHCLSGRKISSAQRGVAVSQVKNC